MPEKQAKGFGQAEKEESFVLKEQAPAAVSKAEKEKQIVLNISEARGGKILLRQREGTITYTGNPVIDTYRKINEFFIDHSKINVKQKAGFFRLLATMLNAGLPLIKSLDTLGAQSEKTPKLAKLLFEMARAIERGQSLSESMSTYSDVFGDAEIGVVKAGEASGQLNKTLRSLAEELEKTASITGKVKGAMIYPLVIMSLLVVVIFLMMIMVVPQITKLFTETNKELPLPTRVLMWLSDFSINYWPFIIIALIALFIGFSAAKKTRTGRYVLDVIKLKLPIFGNIFQKTALSKFARGFSNLMGSGVPIIKSIEIVSHSIGNEVYKRRLLLTAEDMKRGIPMAENLAESKLFPKMLVNMIEIGEQTAQLENVTVKVAEFYDEEIDTVVAALTKIMEPLILVVIGLSVGGIVAAVMMPIMELTNIAGNM
jgi:type IV pilus assembly protein PilC